MEKRRTKLWRRKHGFRVFKARLQRLAAAESEYHSMDGRRHLPLRWYELAREHWTQVYRTTGTPCSCVMCRGEEYSRQAYKRDTRREMEAYEDERIPHVLHLSSDSHRI